MVRTFVMKKCSPHHPALCKLAGVFSPAALLTLSSAQAQPGCSWDSNDVMTNIFEYAL